MRTWLLLTVLVGAGMTAPDQTIDITVERFSFTPSEIKTNVGTTLKIRLRSEDTLHGFRIVGASIDIEVPKRGRGVAEVTFTPKEAGTYRFECSRVCGAGHSMMRGAIVVRAPKTDHDRKN